MLFQGTIVPQLRNLPELKDNGVSFKKKEKEFAILNSPLAVSVYSVGVNYLTHSDMI